MLSEKLIEAVRCHIVLYDTSHTDYLKTKLKDEIWDEIAKELNLTNGATVKADWVKLRNCHRDAIRRQKNCIKSGAAASSIKQWKFQKQMEFLVPYMVNRPRDSNLNDSDFEDSEMIQDDKETVPVANTEHPGNCTVTKIGSISSKIPSSTPQKKKQKDEIGTLLKTALQNHDRRARDRALLRNEMQKVPTDHLFHFFMSIYETTKKMPPASQHFIKNSVFQIVSKVEGELLNNLPTQLITYPQSESPYSFSSTQSLPSEFTDSSGSFVINTFPQ